MYERGHVPFREERSRRRVEQRRLTFFSPKPLWPQKKPARAHRASSSVPRSFMEPRGAFMEPRGQGNRIASAGATMNACHTTL